MSQDDTVHAAAEPGPQDAPTAMTPTPATATPDGAGAASGAPSAAAPPRKSTLLDRAPGWTIPVVFAVLLVGAVVATQVSPDFYPHVVWKYYWGPIVADAWDCSQLGHLQYQAAVAHNLTDSRAC